MENQQPHHQKASKKRTRCYSGRKERQKSHHVLLLLWQGCCLSHLLCMSLSLRTLGAAFSVSISAGGTGLGAGTHLCRCAECPPSVHPHLQCVDINLDVWINGQYIQNQIDYLLLLTVIVDYACLIGAACTGTMSAVWFLHAHSFIAGFVVTPGFLVVCTPLSIFQVCSPSPPAPCPLQYGVSCAPSLCWHCHCHCGCGHVLLLVLWNISKSWKGAHCLCA